MLPGRRGVTRIALAALNGMKHAVDRAEAQQLFMASAHVIVCLPARLRHVPIQPSGADARFLLQPGPKIGGGGEEQDVVRLESRMSRQAYRAPRGDRLDPCQRDDLPPAPAS